MTNNKQVKGAKADHNEVWKPLEGFRGKGLYGRYHYEVSNTGRICRITETRGSLNKQGYLIVKVGDGGGQNGKTVAVHRLIAEAFLGPKPEGMVVNHKDGDKTNNHVDNLEYVTQARNVKHGYDVGTHIPSYKWRRTDAIST